MIDTRSADPSEPRAAARSLDEDDAGTPAQARGRLVGAYHQVVRLGLLACAGLVMQLGWVMVWTFSYRLTHGNDFTYDYLVSQPAVWDKLHALLVLANTLAPGLEGPEGPVSLDIIVNALVFAFIVTGVGYLAGVLLLDLGVSATRGALLVIVGFELIFQVTLFLLPGVFTTDLSSYVMYGHISAVYNLNPYIYPPNYFPGYALLNWIHPIWHDQPSVYGPVWTDLSWLLTHLMQPWDGLVQPDGGGGQLQIGLMNQLFGYKLLMNGVQLVNLGLVWWLLGRLLPKQPRARLTSFAVFAWNPLMLFDAPGNAHNDALMVMFLLLGVAPLVLRHQRVGGPRNRDWVLGTVFVALSALVKYTTGLVGLFYVVAWARRLRSWPARVGWIGGTGLLVAVISVVLFLPWLDKRAFEPMLVAVEGKSWMFTNWAPDLLALTISDQILAPRGMPLDAAQELVRGWFKLGAKGLFVIYLAWEIVRLWRRSAGEPSAMLTHVLETSVRAFMVLILLVLTWVLEWYWFWPLALATLLGWRRMLTKVVVGYTLTSLPIFYVHHYWSSHMPGVLILAYALPPLALPLAAWGGRRLARLWPRLSARRVLAEPAVQRLGLE